MQQFTSLYINNLVNSLKNLDGIASVTKQMDRSQIQADELVADDTYFQIILVEINNNSQDLDFINLLNMEHCDDVTIKLVYGKKKDLITYYPGVNYLPSPGVKVDPQFIPLSQSMDQRERGIFSTVRFLLQSRKLSQMMAFTWVKENEVPENKKIPVKLVRKIFHSYNIIPDTRWLNNGKLSPKLENKELAQNLLNVDNSYLYYLIKPEYISYSSIPLALLLSGQAYYKYKDNPQWNRIWQPIYSTYEMIWEYALDISWDSYYATRVDISQTGITPNPPYTKVTLGYPARPQISEYSLTETEIQEWAFADDYDNDKLPFYPPQDSPEWKNKQLKYVVSPYPYIPLSCS